MSDDSFGVPVTKGRNLKEVHQSFYVLGENDDSSLEMKLALECVSTFDRIIKAQRAKSRVGALYAAHYAHSPADSAVTETQLDLSHELSVATQLTSRTARSIRYKRDEINQEVNAINYLKRKKIFELFNYFIVHLLGAKPDDPVQFLVTLLNRCLYFRSQFQGRLEPPLLFSKDHVRTLYHKFDTANTGYITVEQYRQAMSALGIGRYGENLPADSQGRTTEDAFIAEATRRLTAQLLSLVPCLDHSATRPHDHSTTRRSDSDPTVTPTEDSNSDV